MIINNAFYYRSNPLDRLTGLNSIYGLCCLDIISHVQEYQGDNPPPLQTYEGQPMHRYVREVLGTLRAQLPTLLIAEDITKFAAEVRNELEQMARVLQGIAVVRDILPPECGFRFPDIEEEDILDVISDSNRYQSGIERYLTSVSSLLPHPLVVDYAILVPRRIKQYLDDVPQADVYIIDGSAMTTAFDRTIGDEHLTTYQIDLVGTLANTSPVVVIGQEANLHPGFEGNFRRNTGQMPAVYFNQFQDLPRPVEELVAIVQRIQNTQL